MLQQSRCGENYDSGELPNVFIVAKNFLPVKCPQLLAHKHLFYPPAISVTLLPLHSSFRLPSWALSRWTAHRLHTALA